MTPRRVLAVLAVAQLCGMAPWFSASAVAPALTAAWRLRPGGAAWLTISVQLGFVAGALVSAALTLSDRWSARRLAAAASLGAAVATLAVAFSRGPAVGIAARVATGAALAGVYPPGMKIAAGWFRDGRGWAIGMLVGALTVGSAAPHLMRWLVPAEAWRLVQFTRVRPQVRIVDEPPQITLEVHVVNGVEADQRGKQANVGFGQPRPHQVALASKPFFEPART